MNLLPRPLLLLSAASLICSTALAQTAPATAPATPPASTTATPQAADNSSAAALQSIDPAKVAEIRKMLELVGTVKLMNQLMGQMINSMRARNSSLSNEFWDRFEKDSNTEELVDRMIPLYDKYYSLDDLKAVNAFYQSPAGQRVLAATPQIMRESMTVGQQWGQEMTLKIAREIEAEKQKEAASAASAKPSTPSSAPATPAPASSPAPAPATAPSSP